MKGIKLPRAPNANPDGSYNIKLTPDQWQTFQDNQQSQTQSAPEPAAQQPGAEQPDAQQPSAQQPAALQPDAQQPAAQQPAAPEQPEITASKDPSMSFLWHIDTFHSIFSILSILSILKRIK